MSVVAVVDVCHEDLGLTPTVRSGSAEEIRVISHSTTDPETGMFFFLVRGADETFEDQLLSDPTVSEWTLVADSEETRVYRIRHPRQTKLLSPNVTELGGLMLEVKSNGDLGWTLRLQLPDRGALSDLWEFCEREGISFDLKQMFRQKGWVDGEPSGLTDAQRDALTTAYREGYFEEPRDASLVELADALDISPTAVGGRIRRGTAELVRATLVDEEG